MTKHTPQRRYLFKVDDTNDGVFLVLRGKVALLVEGLPHLDRVFLADSVVGLPSTFTGNAYSLTALTLVDSEIVHVPRKEFLKLMSRDSTLCQEATEMLGRELSFIQTALAQRVKRKSQNERPSGKPPRAGMAALTPRLAKRSQTDRGDA